MNVNIRYPNITGRSEGEQILQVRSYLYQLVEQLNIALRSVEETTTSNGTSAQNDNASYGELRTMVYQEIKRIEQMLEAGYVKDEEVSAMINSALTEAKESGEFDGPPGPEGPKGEDGTGVTILGS